MNKLAVLGSVCVAIGLLGGTREVASQTRSASAASYIDRGLEFHRKGNLDRAIADYTIAIPFDPKSAPAHFNRGSAYQQQAAFA